MNYVIFFQMGPIFNQEDKNKIPRAHSAQDGTWDHHSGEGLA